MSAPQGGRRTPEEGEGGAIDNLRTAMEGMNVGRYEMEEGGVVEVEQDDMEVEGGGGVLALEATGLLTQDAELCGTTLVDACHSFNDMIRLVMLCTLRHHWPPGAKFLFNCYRHWAQLVLRQPGDTPFIILIKEGFMQGDPLSMVLYGITLFPLVE